MHELHRMDFESRWRKGNFFTVQMQTYGVGFCGGVSGHEMWTHISFSLKNKLLYFFFFFNVPMDHWVNFRIQSLTVSKDSQLIFNIWWFSKSTLDSSLSLNTVVITFQNFLLTPETENCLHLANKGETKKPGERLLFWVRQRLICLPFL